LAWIGEPILNDTLYGGTCRPVYPPALQPGEPETPGKPEKPPIVLRAQVFRFPDPATGTEKEYRLPGFAG
jgi:23S rRNA-/tRNA-specific pseudouridylate synthase